MNSSDERIRIFSNMVCPVSGIFVTKFDLDLKVIYSTAPSEELLTILFTLATENQRDVLLQDERLQNPEQAQGRITLHTNHFGAAWLSEARLNEEGKMESYTLGPVFLRGFLKAEIARELDRFSLPVSKKHLFLEQMRSIPVMTLTRLFEYGVMFHYAITEKHIDFSDFVIPSDPDPEPFWFEEKRYKPMGYVMEQKLMQLIEEGNLNYREERQKVGSLETWNTFGGENIIRQVKNTVIINTALSARAAVRGGLSPETAFTLSDRFIEETEGAQELNTLYRINDQMTETYVRRVRDVKMREGVSPQIQKCCDYINTHLNEKVDIQMLSSMVGYTDYYFSKKFKKEMGISVREYATSRKMEAAKHYLKDTSMNINEIAAELGYVNQSYFTDVFRRTVGLTPTEYRNSLS